MGRSIRYGWSICGGTLGMDSALSMRGKSLNIILLDLVSLSQLGSSRRHEINFFA